MQNGTVIHAAFLERARVRPDALAIASQSGTLTYGQLERASRALAGEIAPPPGEPARVAAILAERGPELIVAMLACARAGRPFVVLDRAYPAARLQTLIDIARPTTLLLAGPGARQGLARCVWPAIAVELDAEPVETDAPLPTVSPDDPAYLLFTSGSTGTPKCIAVSHRPLAHFVGWQTQAFGLTEDDRFTLLSGVSHDPVLRDVFTPLSLGASIHIPAQETLTAPGGLYAWFRETRPTVAHMTPPLGRLLTTVRDAPGALTDLRHGFFGGDVLRGELADAVEAHAPNCQVVNFYGATETPQAIAYHRVPRGRADDRAPIGCAVDGFELRVRDADGGEARVGDVGEIVVRSPYLALGYVKDGRLPAPRPADAIVSYATGDLGYRRSDAQLVIQGRRDDQIKIRGYRVELGEITACVLGLPGAGQAMTLNAGTADAARLACFVEPRRGAVLDVDAVRRQLAALLPAYMVPDTIAPVDALPLLPNGKIDRQALLALVAQRAETPTPATSSAANAACGKLIGEWARIFPASAVGPASTFASLGGDSLSYVNAYLSLEELLGEVPDGWTTLTLAEMTATAPAPAADSTPAKRSRFAPVESAILMRAVAISAVVASHFGLLVTAGAATSALLWVSGFLFGGLQLSEAEHQGDLKPLWRVLRSLLLPLLAITVPQVLVKMATHGHVDLASLALSIDLLDFTKTSIEGPNAYGGHDYLMWYVHCVFHIILIFAGLLFVCRTWLKLRQPVMGAAIAAVGLGVVARFALPAMLDPTFGSVRIDGPSFFYHSPTANLATFALAALAGYLRGRYRAAIMGLTALYAAVSTPIFGALDAVPIALVAAILLYMPKISLPRIAVAPVFLVAGASFFIYLLQFKFLAVFTHIHLPMLLAWPLALAGGVAAWSAWNWGARRIAVLWGAMRSRAQPIWRLTPQGV